MLSSSATTGIDCPGTYPLCGRDTIHVKGPDLHQQQQKYFSIETLTGSFKRGIKFKSTGDKTVKAAFVS